jgi:hypothetical protein
MPTSDPNSSRRILENKLLAEVVKRQEEWNAATPDNRKECHDNYLKALRVFNDLVLHGKLPE